MVANEGDPRDTDFFSEKVRVGDLPLDPVAFPDAAALQRPEALGRFQVTKVEGDPDGGGDVDRLVLLGRDRGRTYAFVAFEGTGRWMAFDVTNPRRVSFQQDYNARNFDIDPSRACGPRRNPKPPGCARAPASRRRERA